MNDQTEQPKAPQLDEHPMLKIMRDYIHFRDGFMVKDCYFIGGEPPMKYEEEKLPNGPTNIKVVCFRMEDRFCFHKDSFPHVTPAELRAAIEAVQHPDATLDSMIDAICEKLKEAQIKPFLDPALNTEPQEPGIDSPGFGK